MRILDDNKTKKKHLRNLKEKDAIDSILLQMLSEEGAIHNKIKSSLENSEEIFNRKMN